MVPTILDSPPDVVAEEVVKEENAAKAALDAAKERAIVRSTSSGFIEAGEIVSGIAEALPVLELLYINFTIYSELVNQVSQLIKEINVPVVTSSQTQQVAPTDPNFISGPAGSGSSGFVAATAPMPYLIGFENEASADAPAQVVQVTQQLSSNLDWSTFQLGDFGFGGQSYTVPAGLTSYSTVIDARSTVGVYVEVDAEFNAQTGVLTWTFTSLDPSTLDIPVGNPEEGFLPPNATAPEGARMGELRCSTQGGRHRPGRRSTPRPP